MPNKYRNRPVVVDGIRFDSLAESRRWGELSILERAGHIKDLERQERFDLLVNNKKIGQYRADFSYIDARDGRRIIEDVKGVRTPVYKLKKKHVEAQYGVEISEVMAR